MPGTFIVSRTAYIVLRYKITRNLLPETGNTYPPSHPLITGFRLQTLSGLQAGIEPCIPLIRHPKVKGPNDKTIELRYMFSIYFNRVKNTLRKSQTFKLFLWSLAHSLAIQSLENNFYKIKNTFRAKNHGSKNTKVL